MKKWAKRIGYGIGDLGCNLVFSTMASYLMVFYTDVFGITAAAAGTKMLVTKFIDALTDTGIFRKRRNGTDKFHYRNLPEKRRLCS